MTARALTSAEYRAQIAKTMREDALQAKILQLASETGWLAYHPYDSRRSRPGFPDPTLVHPRTGHIVFAELKSQRGRPTVDQRAWLTALAANPSATVAVFLWRPSDWLDGSIQRVLTQRGEVTTHANADAL